ncbi:MAG TPA: EI24 domain-containing protein [Actinoplanes sp.]
MGAAARQFVLGASLLGRGLSIVLRRPRLLLFGLVPALISGVLYAAALITLIGFLPDLTGAVTWFADDWATSWHDGLRIFAGLALLGAAGMLGVLSFTAVTLLIGDPFYERISSLVEGQYGGVPGGGREVAWWRNAVDSLRLITVSVLFGVPLFALGLIPVVGQTLAPVLGGMVGGWLLAMELTGVPFQRRGQRLRDRRRVLRTHRPLTLGFGVAVFASFLIPLGAILLMPAAVAGAALLARRALGQPIDIVTVPVRL